MDHTIKELQELGRDIRILYVEDNHGLRENIHQLLQKIFRNILVAEDGEAGYQVFKDKKPHLVITDINMPKLNGLEMAERIKKDEPDTKIIYLTAFNETEYLFKAINAGVFRYLLKPTNGIELVDALLTAIKTIQHEESKRIFDNQLKDIFNYQNNLLMMFKNANPVIVNQRFLDFFGVDSLDIFLERHPQLDDLLKMHQGFLSSNETSSWFDIALENPGKLYHTKILNHEGEGRHLIMKLRQIPQQENNIIISFDDVTELNLLALFDKDASKRDKALKDKNTVLKFMKIVDDNHAEVKLHNFYRGLTITNPAAIILIDDDKVVVKTSYSQLKIAKLVKTMTISSEVFPAAVQCKAIKEIDFDKQTIVFTEMQFIDRSGNDRQHIRLEPEDSHSVTLFFEGKKFFGEVKVIDISVVSVKLELNALPPGITVDQDVSISVVLPTGTAPLNINTPAKIYRIEEHKRLYHIILIFELTGLAHKRLLDYLAQRQMALIREFRTLEISL